MADDRWTMQEDPEASDGAWPAEDEAGAPPLPNVFARAVLVMVSPGKLFAGLAVQPAVVGIMLLSAAVLMAVFAVASPAGAEVLGPALARGLALLSAVAEALLGPVVFTLVTMLLFRVIRRDDATFKQHLAVNAHALFIGAVGAVCTLPLVLSTGDPTQTLSVGSLFFFFPDGFLAKLLSSFGLFDCWAMAVAALGLSALDERRTWRGTLIVLAGLWIVVNVVGVAIGGFFLDFAEGAASAS